MSELQWEEVKEKLQVILKGVDPNATTTKDIFRLLTEELGKGVKSFKTEIKACIAAFFEETSTEEEGFSIKLSSTVTLSVVTDSGKKSVEIHQEDGKKVTLSGWDFCTLASKLGVLKGAIADSNDRPIQANLSILNFRRSAFHHREAFDIELQQHNEGRDEGEGDATKIIDAVIRMDADALDILKENKNDILQALQVLQSEEVYETGIKRPLETEEAHPEAPQKKEKDEQPPSKARKTQKDDEVYGLQLSSNIRLAVSEFKGRMRTDIRRYYTEKTSGELRPTQKGLSMDMEQLSKFVECFDDLKAAVKDHMTDYYVEIGHNRRVSVSDFTGRCLVDLREYFNDKSGGPPKPGKKGICFDVGILDSIASHINSIMTAMK